MSITRVMILSLTFWKNDTSKNKPEKQYLHSKIVWHPVWRDLDFWSASLFFCIREELRNQKELEEHEAPAETIDREKNIVFGQLLSFSHNMVTFMVEKQDIKKVIEKFCYYFDLAKDKVAMLSVRFSLICIKNFIKDVQPDDLGNNKKTFKEERPKVLSFFKGLVFYII